MDTVLNAQMNVLMDNASSDYQGIQNVQDVQLEKC